MGKHRDFPYSSLSHRFRVNENPSLFGNVQMSIKFKFSGEGHIIPTLFKEIRRFYEAQTITEYD